MRKAFTAIAAAALVSACSLLFRYDQQAATNGAGGQAASNRR